MKAKELRLGNLIYVKYDGINPQTKIRKVSLATISEVTRDGNDISYKPIPLIEEWLLKFGFKKASQQDSSYSRLSVNLDNYHILEYSKIDNCVHITNTQDCYYNIETSAEYVHQLQNLYFALMGEELIIK